MKKLNVSFSIPNRTKGYPVYVESPAVINNIIAAQVKEDKAKFEAIVRNKKTNKIT